MLHQQFRPRNCRAPEPGAPQAAGGGGAQRGQSGGSAGEGLQPPAFVAGGGTSGPCGEGTQKPSRRREMGPDKSPLHGCKSPRCCYFIYRCPREDCLLLQNFKLFFPPPFPSFSPRCCQQRSLVPQCRVQTEPTCAPGRGAAPEPPTIPVWTEK